MSLPCSLSYANPTIIHIHTADLCILLRHVDTILYRASGGSIVVVERESLLSRIHVSLLTTNIVFPFLFNFFFISLSTHCFGLSKIPPVANVEGGPGVSRGLLLKNGNSAQSRTHTYIYRTYTCIWQKTVRC